MWVDQLTGSAIDYQFSDRLCNHWMVDNVGGFGEVKINVRRLNEVGDNGRNHRRRGDEVFEFDPQDALEFDVPDSQRNVGHFGSDFHFEFAVAVVLNVQLQDDCFVARRDEPKVAKSWIFCAQLRFREAEDIDQTDHQY